MNQEDLKDIYLRAKATSTRRMQLIALNWTKPELDAILAVSASALDLNNPATFNALHPNTVKIVSDLLKKGG
jgi:hypothetical protein